MAVQEKMFVKPWSSVIRAGNQTVMAISNSVQSGVVLWITFPDFLSSGWIAQQELVVLNIIERMYGNAQVKGWRRVEVFHKGSALIVQGLEPRFVFETQKALMKRGMDVSLRTTEAVDDPVW